MIDLDIVPERAGVYTARMTPFTGLVVNARPPEIEVNIYRVCGGNINTVYVYETEKLYIRLKQDGREWTEWRECFVDARENNKTCGGCGYDHWIFGI